MLSSSVPVLAKPLIKKLSKIKLPFLANSSEINIEAFRKAEELAFHAAREIRSLIIPGWTEKQAATLLDNCLRDHGVKNFFHQSYVWFGERTCFTGISRKNYWAYMPTERSLRPGEEIILDVAPIVNGYICDIGFSDYDRSNEDLEVLSSGTSSKMVDALQFLDSLYRALPRWFENCSELSQIWELVDQKIYKAGYTNIHAKYPFSVLGHRVHKASENPIGNLIFANFGIQAYTAFLSRGLFSQLLGPSSDGSPIGVWAIEPHIGWGSAGAKFEQILHFDGKKAKWLSPRSISRP